MDGVSVARRLESEEDIAEVKDEDAQAREMGVNGVPCFIVAGKYVVNGAQPADMWARVLSDIQGQLDQKSG